MKLTVQRLKGLIREELNKLNEGEGFYGSPEQVMSMDKIMTMFDVQSGSKESARQASEIAVSMGLGEEVLNQLHSMMVAMKKQRQKGRNMFQHEEDKQKLDSFIVILQQVMDQNRPPVTPPKEGPDLSDYL